MKTYRVIVISVLMFFVTSASAQERPIHEVYSMMVFNFIKYIQWPDHEKPGEFVIAVMGSNDMFNTLTAWYAGKAKGNKIYAVKKFNSVDEISDCHVLFIDRSKSSDFVTINIKLKGKGTLIVTDKNGMGEKGSCINFKTVNEKLRFELNQAAIEASNLKVSSALSSMAILI